MTPSNRILLATLAVLTALLFFDRLGDKEVPATRLVLPAVELEQVTAFEIERKDETLRVERSGEAWVVTKPFADTADGQQVRSFLQGFSKEQSTGVRVAAGDEADDPFGFESSDGVKLTVEGADGAILHLELGRNGERGVLFVRSASGAPVYRMNISGSYRLRAEAKTWRDLTLTDCGTAEPQALEYGFGGRTWSFQRNEDGDWTLEGRKVDGRTLGGVVRTLCHLKGKDVEASFGSEIGGATITLDSGDEVAVRFGHGPDPETLTAQGANERVMTLPRATLERIDLSKQALVDKTVMSFDVNDVLEIRYGQGERYVSMRPTGQGGWMPVKMPDPSRFAPQAALGLARTLSDLHADKVAKISLRQAGITDQSPHWTVTTGSQGSLELILGGEGEAGFRYIARGGDKRVFAMRTGVLDGLLETFGAKVNQGR